MPANPYFAEEVEFLRQLAHENPALAPLLAQANADPDVERVLEGVAFLTAGIRARLDDDLPELTQTLLEMLWPHYLRPLPSLAIAEFAHPAKPVVSTTQLLPREQTELESVPVDGTPCRFRTCYDVALHPLRIESARLDPAGRGALRVRFALLEGARAAELELDPLRLYLHGELANAAQLYLWLLRRAGAVCIEVEQPGSSTPLRHWLPESPPALRPVGFAPEHGLLPYPARSFPGYRLLQEYFALPQKFLFVDVCGIPPLRELGVQSSFELVVPFRERPPDTLRVDTEQLRLHCTPIVNLRAIAGDPLAIAPQRRSYLLRASHPEPAHFEVYSVDQVTGLLQGRSERREYPSFYSFRHGLGPGGEASYYQVTRRPARAHPNSDCFIQFVAAGGKAALPEAESVSLELTCTNRTLCEGLLPGDVRVHGDRSPQYAEFRNLTTPTRSVLPLLADRAHWGLISHLALNFSSLASADSLRAALRLYAFHALHDRPLERALARRLEAIGSVESGREERLFQGAPLRGVHTRIELDEAAFASEGELFLFAAVLEEFLALYVTLNSFSALSVRGARRGEVYAWKPRLGRQAIL